MKGIPGSPATKKIDKPFVPMERSFEHHRFWPTQTGETFIKAVAFQYLWLQTEVGPRVRYVEGVRVELGPGQCIVDERSLASVWKWSRGRVRRFLDDCSMGGEASLERYHWGTKVTLHKQVTWWGSETADGTTNRTGDSTTESPVTVPPSIQETLRPRDLEITPDDDPVDNSVDNPSMPRKVAEVVEAFQQASKSMKPPSVPDKLAVEKAIKANGGDYISIREYVRKATAEGVAYAKKSGSDPPHCVRYGLAAWNRRNERGPDPRPEKQREPESRPIHRAYHERVRPVPTRPMTDEEGKSGAAHVRDVLSRIKLRPDRSGKK